MRGCIAPVVTAEPTSTTILTTETPPRQEQHPNLITEAEFYGRTYVFVGVTYLQVGHGDAVEVES